MQTGSLRDLSVNRAVRRLVEAQIAAANEQLSEIEQIRQFDILPADLDDVDALTPTHKIRRGKVTEQFGHLIDGMYRDRTERAP